jgi:hypothetical protein
MFNKKANRISILCHEQRNAISTPKSKIKPQMKPQKSTKINAQKA